MHRGQYKVAYFKIYNYQSWFERNLTDVIVDHSSHRTRVQLDVVNDNYLSDQLSRDRFPQVFNMSESLDIDVRSLPDNLPSSTYVLSLLVHHDWDDIAPALTDSEKEALAPDQPGKINLTALSKSFTIVLNNGLKNDSKWVKTSE